jgi:hypothetical protein
VKIGACAGSGRVSTLRGVSVPPEPDRSKMGSSNGGRAAPAGSDDAEVLDALPVLADGPMLVHAYPIEAELERNRRSPATVMPVVQTAAVAAGGFVAGAAVVGLVHRRRGRSALAKGRRFGRAVGRAGGGASAAEKAAELVQIVGSRSFIVDVHLLGGRD